MSTPGCEVEADVGVTLVLALSLSMPRGRPTPAVTIFSCFHVGQCSRSYRRLQAPDAREDHEDMKTFPRWL